MTDLSVLILEKRCGEGSLDGPAIFQAHTDGVCINPDALAPLNQSQRLTVKVKLPIAGCVPALFAARRPSAIFRAVRTVVVSAVNRMILGWSRTHIGVEVFKLHPAIAYRNATTAVVLPALVLLVGTAVAHIVPDVPLRTDSAFSSHAVTQIVLPHAATARASAIAQSGSIDRSARPTITLAKPSASVGSGANGPMAEALACHVYECWHEFKFTTEPA